MKKKAETSARDVLLSAISADVRRSVEQATYETLWADVCPFVCERLADIQRLDESVESIVDRSIYATA